MVAELIHVDSPNVSYDGDQITVDYEYSTTSVKKIDNRLVVSVFVGSFLLLLMLSFHGCLFLFTEF